MLINKALKLFTEGALEVFVFCFPLQLDLELWREKETYIGGYLTLGNHINFNIQWSLLFVGVSQATCAAILTSTSCAWWLSGCEVATFKMPVVVLWPMPYDLWHL